MAHGILQEKELMEKKLPFAKTTSDVISTSYPVLVEILNIGQ